MKRIVVFLALITALMIWVLIGSKSLTPGNNGEEITVFSAAGLTESLTKIKEVYEQSHENVVVNLNFAGSQTLKTSLENGEKADIFISANLKYMDELKDKGFVNDYRIFMNNRLILVRNKNSAFFAKDLKDLAEGGISIAVGDTSVPVGSYWEKTLDIAARDGVITASERDKIDENIKTREINVKDVMSKVLLGEVDFGVVYRSDITKVNEDKVEELELGVFSKVNVEYPMAILKDSEDKSAVKEFYDFLNSSEGKGIFREYRFIVE